MKKLLLTISVLLAFTTTAGVSYNIGHTSINRVDVASEQYASDTNVFDAINKLRSENGLSTLQHNDLLDQSSKAKAEHMDQFDYWSHDSPSGVTPWVFFSQAKVPYIKAGENLARGQFRTVDQLIQAWYDSPTHKANMLDPVFTHLSVDVRIDEQGTPNVVTHYAELR